MTDVRQSLSVSVHRLTGLAPSSRSTVSGERGPLDNRGSGLNYGFGQLGPVDVWAVLQVPPEHEIVIIVHPV